MLFGLPADNMRVSSRIRPESTLNGPFIRGSANSGYARRMRRRDFLGAILASLALGMAAPGEIRAQYRRRHRPRRRGSGPAGSGQDRARRALREGRVLPLGDILSAVGRRIPGKVLDVDLAQTGTGYLYHLKILGPDGGVTSVVVDGGSGRILSVGGGGR